MVDSTSVMDILGVSAPDYFDMEQVDSAASMYFGNALALIKLREKGVYGVCKFPKGVFKCILEYCEPAMIKRVSHHYKYNPEYPINY